MFIQVKNAVKRMLNCFSSISNSVFPNWTKIPSFWSLSPLLICLTSLILRPKWCNSIQIQQLWILLSHCLWPVGHRPFCFWLRNMSWLWPPPLPCFCLPFHVHLAVVTALCLCFQAPHLQIHTALWTFHGRVKPSKFWYMHFLISRVIIAFFVWKTYPQASRPGFNVFSSVRSSKIGISLCISLFVFLLWHCLS